MRFLIKFATRGRPEWFKRGIGNILSTIKTKNFKILVSADNDDPSMKNESIRDFVSRSFSTQIVFGNSKTKIEAINADMEYAGEWDILVNFSDDMTFIREGWDRIVQRRVRDIWGYDFDFFAHFNDGYTKDALATMSIIGRDYYKRDGYIYHPSYKSFSCDAEGYYVAVMRGRHHYFTDELFLHQHPANKPQPNDETYRKNALATNEDTQNYWARLRRYFDEPVNENTPIPFKQHL